MEDSYDEKKGGKLFWKATTSIFAFLVVVLLFVLVKLLFLHDEVLPKEYGMFTSKPTFDATSPGRIASDLQNVAIILKSTSRNDTERWLADIKRQRLDPDDLPIYVYPDHPMVYTNLRKIIKNFEKVFALREFNGTLHSDLLKKPEIEYIIDIDDEMFGGADFADYYYLGQKVMKSDQRIECVCGGSKHQSIDFFQPSQGDLFWLMDQDLCDLGMMQHRDAYAESSNKLITCLRPEVPRVSFRDEFVTKMTFNVAKMDPSLLTVDQISQRMESEIKNAKSMQKLDWDDLKRQNEHIVYKFPFSNQELVDYFETPENVIVATNCRIFNGTIPLFVSGRKVYLVEEPSENEVESFFKFF